MSTLFPQKHLIQYYTYKKIRLTVGSDVEIALFRTIQECFKQHGVEITGVDGTSIALATLFLGRRLGVTFSISSLLEENFRDGFVHYVVVHWLC
jgi:hypothetical protein